MKDLYFSHLRADGCIRIPAGIIDGMLLVTGSGFAIEPDQTAKFLYLQILPITRNRKPDKTADKEGEPS